MTKFEDMSRDELIKAANELKKAGMRLANRPEVAQCPFCEGYKFVPYIKMAVKQSVIEEWKRDVTQEELEAFIEERNKQFERPSCSQSAR